MASSAVFDEIARYYAFCIPPGSRVLDLGCGSGELLAHMKPAAGIGLDIDGRKVRRAVEQHGADGRLRFLEADIEQFDYRRLQPFDYIILADILPLVQDIQQLLINLRPVCTPATRLVISYRSNLWRPATALANLFRPQRRTFPVNWLSTHDIRNLLFLSGFDGVTRAGRTLMPLKIPGVTALFNRVLAKLPFIQQLCLNWLVVARPVFPAEEPRAEPDATVSVVIPTRNERGNIEAIFRRTPRMGRWTELIFVDGRSTDGTVAEIERCMQSYASRWERVLLLHQNGTGKGDAVRQGFSRCRGDILMILDSDLTMPPEALPKYYRALTGRKADLVNGCRLVYPMQDKAMRFLNMLANHLFAHLFSWLIGQQIKDTLCGTKVLWRRDYEKIAANRHYFGDFDPFGDFDLLLGASKLNCKIIDLPVRYRQRTYGDIKIHRWRHGWQLMRMLVVAFVKLKLS